MKFRVALALCCASWLCASALWAGTFALPTETVWQTWEAEDAARSGSWDNTSDPSASGGVYLQTDDATATVQYHFRADRPTTLRVRPVWWRTGNQASATRFPYPLPRQFGPENLQPCGDRLLFLAPATGRVGLFDAQAEKLLSPIPVGGTLTDLVVAPDGKRAYVTDARGDRVVVLDPAGGVLASWPAGRQPWALALLDARLYVGCRGDRTLQVFDTATGQLVRTVPLPAPPLALEPVGNPATGLLVRYQQQPVQMQTLALPEPDQLQYNAREARTSAAYGREKRFEVDTARQAIKVTKGGATTEISVADLCTGANGKAPAGLRGYPAPARGPASLLVAGDRVYFTLPAAGRVGVVDAKKETVIKVFDFGGCPVDLAATQKADKVYVADAALDAVYALSSEKLEVAATIKTPAGPVALQLVETYNLQRPYMVPGLPVQRVFVTCYDGQALAVVDLKDNTLARTIPLGFTPRYVKLVPSPNPDWWPLLADDRISFAMTPKAAVEPVPTTLDLATFALSPAATAGEGVKRNNSVKLTFATQQKTVASTGNLLLTCDGVRQVDASAVCDPQLDPQPPLQPGDTPGAVTVSLDGGPEFDWRRGLWTRPDNNMMLVYDDDEYWRWNAPQFTVKPGEHVLTLKTKAAGVTLDAVAVQPAADQTLAVSIVPEPWSLHSQIPSGAYQGLFYDQEPAHFTVTVTNQSPTSQTVRLSGVLHNYLGQATAVPGLPELTLGAQESRSLPLRLASAERGRSTLTLTARCEAGDLTTDVRFVRLPKLEHPRLFFRADQEEAIRRRIAQHPVLFKRYADWLLRMSAKEGKFPERFLPNGLLQSELALAAPPDAKDPAQQYGWRMYELGWRMLAVQFAARYLPQADRATLQARLKPLLEASRSATWCQYHHHGPFFPGAVEGMVDMAPPEMRESLPLNAFFEKYKGNMDVYPYTLMSLKEPLSPADRALVYRLAILHSNFERYFETHEGTRGGTWWQNPWSWCYCPTQGLFLTELFAGNFFGEPRLLEKPAFRGYVTFMEHADPIADKSSLLPGLTRPSGEPWRWILTAVTRHPLEKWDYGWDQWLAKMEGPLPDEEQAVDDLMSLKGMRLAGPLSAAPHHFNTAVSVPVALALGWYDPQGPTATWDELPPTTLFDKEGWATLRSGRDADATEVWFMSGLRDHTTRHQPNSFMLARAGRFLVGTPALWVDDGNCSPSWGNTVVAGDRWLQRWQTNLHAPRSLERACLNRFTPENWAYLGRERQLSAYAPAEGGFGGGLDLHGHTQTLMMDDGRLTGYETWPEFDYVAGETTGAWPLDEMPTHRRQLLYLKPNVLVIYDRAQLGQNGHPSRWLACTGPDLTIQGNTFRVNNVEAKLAGQVLLPRRPTVENVPVLPTYQWKKQQLLQISDPAEGNAAEYLVVLTTGSATLAPARVTLTERGTALDLSLQSGGRQYDLRLSRRGPSGGTLTFTRGGQRLRHDLPCQIEDTYRNWNTDPRYRQWLTDPRFDFIINRDRHTYSQPRR